MEFDGEPSVIPLSAEAWDLFHDWHDFTQAHGQEVEGLLAEVAD